MYNGYYPDWETLGAYPQLNGIIRRSTPGLATLPRGYGADGAIMLCSIQSTS